MNVSTEDSGPDFCFVVADLIAASADANTEVACLLRDHGALQALLPLALRLEGKHVKPAFWGAYFNRQLSIRHNVWKLQPHSSGSLRGEWYE